VIYILCDQLREGMGNALIDTGSQILLVAADSLFRGAKLGKQTIKINGIMGNTMETRGQINLTLGETASHEFTVINELPMNCDKIGKKGLDTNSKYQA
jgi:hypothetical protein